MTRGPEAWRNARWLFPVGEKWQCHQRRFSDFFEGARILGWRRLSGDPAPPTARQAGAPTGMGPTAVNKYVPCRRSQLPAASVTCDLWSWAAYSNLVMICPFCACFTLYKLISHYIHSSKSGIRDSRQASTALCKFQMLQPLNYDLCLFSVGGASTLSGMPSLNHDPESFSRQKSRVIQEIPSFVCLLSGVTVLRWSLPRVLKQVTHIFYSFPAVNREAVPILVNL